MEWPFSASVSMWSKQAMEYWVIFISTQNCHMYSSASVIAFGFMWFMKKPSPKPQGSLSRAIYHKFPKIRPPPSPFYTLLWGKSGERAFAQIFSCIRSHQVPRDAMHDADNHDDCYGFKVYYRKSAVLELIPSQEASKQWWQETTLHKLVQWTRL